MLKRITPLFLLLASLALFSFFIIPQYKEVMDRREEIGFLNEALNNSKKVQTVRDALLASYNNIADADLERLKKILPDHVDNVRLILEFDRIASRNNMILQNVATRDSARGESDAFGPDDALFGKIRMSFALAGSYESLVKFLVEIEQSLRVVDIVSLSFAITPGDLYEYDMEVDTYWLK